MRIDVTATVVVAGAIATRDFMPVHHDRDYANSQGSPDIFMNIMTDNGYCSRFLTDWAGPEAMVRKHRDSPRRAGATPGSHARVHRHGHRQVAASTAKGSSRSSSAPPTTRAITCPARP